MVPFYLAVLVVVDSFVAIAGVVLEIVEAVVLVEIEVEVVGNFGIVVGIAVGTAEVVVLVEVEVVGIAVGTAVGIVEVVAVLAVTEQHLHNMK